MIKDHVQLFGALIGLAMILATAIYFVHVGMHEGTLLGVIITGGVAIAQQISGIKPSTPPAGTAPPQQPQIPQIPQLPQTPAPPPVVVVAGAVPPPESPAV